MAHKRAVLVYQRGIANVFSVTSFNLSDYGRDAVRLLQAGFSECEWFARGMGAAGVVVRSAYCNLAGDASHATWREDLENAPFCNGTSPVEKNTKSKMV